MFKLFADPDRIVFPSSSGNSKADIMIHNAGETRVLYKVTVSDKAHLGFTSPKYGVVEIGGHFMATFVANFTQPPSTTTEYKGSVYYSVAPVGSRVSDSQSKLHEFWKTVVGKRFIHLACIFPPEGTSTAVMVGQPTDK